MLDIPAYFSPKRATQQEQLLKLSAQIFHKGVHVKDSLRRGVWPHLVGVFPPRRRTREERELYMGQLRRVYDSLKGKWCGRRDTDIQVQRLYENIQRDAVRTDPTETFYLTHRNKWMRRRGLMGRSFGGSQAADEGEDTEEDNIQKLVDIMAIYTLEHKGVSYTQGMTDLLSPILYVMQNEHDAYIVFSAMLEQVKDNFGTWCEGTLNRIERLKHLCEVLDPTLHRYLVNGIEEDAFTLFFGMVLIGCRREFSFQDSFHLLEVMWSAAHCMGHSYNSEESLSSGGGRVVEEWMPDTDWAGFMTYESPELVQQVFGVVQSPYKAVQLRRSSTDLSSYEESVGYGSHGEVSPPSEVFTPTLEVMTSDGPTPLNITAIEAEVEEQTYDITPQEQDADPESNPRSASCPFEQNYPGREPLRSDRHERSSSFPSQCSLDKLPQGSTCSADSNLEGHVELFGSAKSGEVQSKPVAVKLSNELSDMSSISSEAQSNDLAVSFDGGRPDATHISAKGTASAIPSSTFSQIPNGSLSQHYTHAQPPLKAATIVELSEDPIGVPDTAPCKNSSSGHYLTTGGPLEISINATTASPVQRHLYINKDAFEDASDDSTDYASSRRMPADIRGQIKAMGMDPSPMLEPDSLHSSRLSPIAPFFDTIEQIASAADTGSIHGRDRDRLSHENSEVSVMISQLVSTERAAPQITPASSLSVPFSRSFPLFLCLAILCQHRLEIMRERLDFIGLSVLMNNNAGRQELDKTIYFARQLQRQYQHYQKLCFGEGPAHRQWLDSVASTDRRE